MSDILDLLDSDEKLLSETKPVSNSGYGGTSGYGGQKPKDTFDYWGDSNVTPAKIDPDNFKKQGKSYIVVVYTQGEEIPEKISKEILELSIALSSKEYVFRHTGSDTDTLQNAIMKTDGIKADSYLPWIKFNPLVTVPKMKRPTGCGYKIAAGGHKLFTKFKNGPRAVLARNVHAALGEECNDPVDFIIAYTKDGAEGFTKGMDFKVTGDLVFYINLAREANIPIFNLHNEDAIKRLVEHIKNKG